jgi:YggT family protein
VILNIVLLIVYYVLVAFVVCMWIRFLIDLGRSLRRDWRPRGVFLVLLSIVIGITDPPLKLTRRVIKPVRLGAVAIDFAWTVVLLVAVILMYVVSSIRV